MGNNILYLSNINDKNNCSMSTLFAYRIFLRTPKQLSILKTKSKEEHFKDIFFQLKDNYKAKFNHRGNEYYMLHNREINDNIHIWDLAKKQEFTKPILGEQHIENIKDVKFPNINLVFNIEKQIVLVEKNTTVFQSVDNAQKSIESYLNVCLSSFDLSAYLIDINDKVEFWSEINEFDTIIDVELDYNPPNFFGTHKDADKFVKDVHEETHYEKFKIILQNKLEGLNFQRKSFGQHISRLSSGAGRYIVTGLKDGVEKTLKSTTKIYTKSIDDIFSKTEKYWNDLFDKINNLNEDEE